VQFSGSDDAWVSWLSEDEIVGIPKVERFVDDSGDVFNCGLGDDAGAKWLNELCHVIGCLGVVRGHWTGIMA